MTRTLRSKRLRALLWYAADGKCQICGEPLGDEWEIDHIIPWVVSKRTNIFELQIAHTLCNRKKGSTTSEA
jgi:5-methylcytosine-specific restriction endonuclease McrA